MTIKDTAYKLLGIPRTFDEFVDNALRNNKRAVDIIISSQNTIDLAYHVSVRVQTGRINRLVVREWVYQRTGDLDTATVAKIILKRASLARAVETALNLQDKGFYYNINGKRIEDAEGDIQRCREYERTHGQDIDKLL